MGLNWEKIIHHEAHEEHEEKQKRFLSVDYAIAIKLC